MIKNCKHCNEEYKTSHSKTSNFCSRACRNKHHPLKYTEEMKEASKISHKGINAGEDNPAYGKFGKDSWSFGTKRTAEQREKMSKAKEGCFGEKNNAWQGGLSFLLYPREFSKELKMKIKERDNFACVICGGEGFCIHHSDYNKRNNEESNLVTLCRNCHAETNHNRDAWKSLFKMTYA